VLVRSAEDREAVHARLWLGHRPQQLHDSRRQKNLSFALTRLVLRAHPPPAGDGRVLWIYPLLVEEASEEGARRESLTWLRVPKGRAAGRPPDATTA
jgi:hypothetical protein